jgi:hypothetical protein
MQLKSIIIIFFFNIFFSGYIISQNTNIPNWFLNNKYYNSLDYAIGISDPNLDTIISEKQAILRALVNYSLFHKSKINSLSTYGLGNQSNNSNTAKTVENAIYTSIFKLDSNFINSFKIENKYINKYKETFILLKFSPDSLVKFNYKIIRRLGFQKENDIFPVSVDEIELIANLNDTLLCNYKINKYSKVIDIKSSLVVNEDTYKTNFSNTKCKYGSFEDNSNNKYLSNKLNYGVWASYFTSIIEKSCLYSSLSSSNTYSLASVNQGNLRNNKNHENDINFNLSAKSIENSLFNFKITEININSNYLDIKLNFEKSTKLKNIAEKNLNRREKKSLKKMKAKNWQCLGYENFEHSWKIFNNYKNSINKESIVSSDEHISSNLNSGIFKSILFSKFDISNQLNSKINNLSNISTSNKKDYQIKSSKSIGIKIESNKIYPYFIFYRKITQKHYEIKTILFYSEI